MTSVFEPAPGAVVHRAAKRRFPLATAALAALLGLANVESAARADGDAQTRTLARELARHGAEAFDQKDYSTALDQFDRAEALFHAPSISVMRARSLAGLGRLVEALDAYEATKRVPLGDNAPSAFRDAVADAEREGEDLRKRIPRLTVRARLDNGDPGELRVLLDGKALPDALLNVERPIDPGRHEIVAQAPGHAPVTRLATLTEGDRVTMEIVLSAAPGGAVADAKRAPAEAVQAPADRSGGRALWGWTLAGVGVAAIGVGTVTGVMALGKKSSLDSECRPGCPPSAASEIDSFRTNRTVSYLGLSLGVASLGVGGYFLLSGRPESAHLTAQVGPQNVLISGAF
jgi:hypothetical protein